MRPPSRVPLRFYAKENLLLVRVFAAVDQDLSDRISEAVGYPTVKPPSKSNLPPRLSGSKSTNCDHIIINNPSNPPIGLEVALLYVQ